MATEDNTFDALRRTPLKEILKSPWQRDGWPPNSPPPESYNFWKKNKIDID